MTSIAEAFNTPANTARENTATQNHAAENNAPHKAAFIPFVTCGDPNIETTKRIILAMQNAGASLIELGIPFSDPTAEGPVIQAANVRALAAGTTTDAIFTMVSDMQDDIHVPLVFMTYANVVFSYGKERFMQRCHEVGIAGIILPDVPFEEKDEFEAVCERYNVALISLIAPTSHERIATIAKNARGFIYLVSSLGTTGERSYITTDLASIVRTIRTYTTIPCAIGFGISQPQQAAHMGAIADGVIVGSAIVKLVERYKNDAPQYVHEYITSMIKAM